MRDVLIIMEEVEGEHEDHARVYHPDVQDKLNKAREQSRPRRKEEGGAEFTAHVHISLFYLFLSQIRISGTCTFKTFIWTRQVLIGYNHLTFSAKKGRIA